MNAGTRDQHLPGVDSVSHHRDALNGSFHGLTSLRSEFAHNLVFVTPAVTPSNIVRLAQNVLDFWAIDDGRRRRKGAAPAPTPNVKTNAAPTPFFTFQTNSKPVRQTNTGYRRGVNSNSYIIYGSDGRPYRVTPNSNYIRSHRGQFGNSPRSSGSGYSGYRTMCVRTCDGFYYPVSNATRRSRLRRDNNVCQSSCGTPAKLFYYSNAGGSIKNMVDLNGRKYSSRKYAFKYRKKLVPNCRCKEQPWAQSEIIRHEQYAQDEADRGVKRVKLVRVAEIKTASAAAKLPAIRIVAGEDKLVASGSSVEIEDGKVAEIKYWQPGLGSIEISAADSNAVEAELAAADFGSGEAAAAAPEVAKDEATVLNAVEANATDGDEAETEYDLAVDEYEDDSNTGPGTEIVSGENVGIVQSRKRLGRERLRRQRHQTSAQRMKQWWRNNRY